MNPRQAGTLLAAGLVTLTCSAVGKGSPRLEVRGPRWVLGGLDARLHVTARGALAERDVLVLVRVRGKSHLRVPIVDGAARVEIPAAALVEGPNSVTVSTGTERSELVVRVVPRAHAYLAVSLVAGVTAAVAAGVRRRNARLSG